MADRGELPLPEEDTERAMYEETIEVLAGYGFHRYEISNYALDGYECRHNVGYWIRRDYLGFGIGAASLMGNVRFQNGAYGTMMYINFVFLAIFFGYSIGSAPIISYHYGSGNHDELKNLFKKSLTLVGTWGIMLALLSQLLASPLSKLFVGYDAELFAMTRHGFRIYCLAYLINGFNIFGSSFFTALNNGVISAAISFLRTLVFQIIMILLLPTLLGINGIWSAVGIAELMTLCVTITFFIKQRKKYHYV